jgi:WD40 repeat protein
MAQTSSASSTKASALVKKVQAHTDDIHVLRIVDAKGNFVTGSKDGCIKGWNKNGVTLQNLVMGRKDNRLWICSAGLKFRHSHMHAAHVNPGKLPQRHSLFFGCRDGKISVFDFSEEHKAYTRRLSMPFKAPHVTKCKERNMNRILAVEHFEGDTYLAGLPGSVHMFHHPPSNNIQRTGPGSTHCSRQLQSFRADTNDWIYTIRKITDSRFAVVQGDSLYLWKFDTQKLEDGNIPVERNCVLLQRKRFKRHDCSRRMGEIAPPDQASGLKFSSRTRAYISSLDYMRDNHEISVGRFDESIVTFQVDQVAAPQIRSRCHQGRIWEVKYLTPNEILSAGEDGFIRLWDLRMKGTKAQGELDGHAGRVSQFEIVDQWSLMSVACPKRPTPKEGGCLYFWDLRKVQ